MNNRILIFKLAFVFTFFSVLCLKGATVHQAKIFSYPLPSIYTSSSTFGLKVNGESVPVVGYNSKYDYAHFSMSQGKVDLEIILAPGTQISSYRISPQKLSIPATISGNRLKFSLQKDEYLIVKIGNLKELVIVADKEEQDKPATSGKGIFNITRAPYLGMASDSILSTKAIQRAINDASNYPGGKGIVYVPAGVYAIGNLELKSNVSLYLEGGAVLRFTGKHQDFKVNARKASQNRDITWWIYTDSGAHDVRIYGRGTLDGNGKYSTEKEKIGNHILAIMQTERFILDGPVIRDSGAWAIIPVRSKDLKFINFKLFNRFDMGENDGIDVMESENVLVKHAIGIALDDPFSCKTWAQDTDLCRNWPGKPKAQKHVVFDDLISWTYCYGYKVGQGVMQNQSNITFKNSVVYDAAVGIGIHHKWGTAAVNNIVFENIDIEQLSYQNDDHRTWMVFLMQNGDKKGSGPFSNLTVKNINVRDTGKSPGKIRGLNHATSIKNIRLKNIFMPGKVKPASSLKAMNLTDTAYVSGITIYPKK
jgi:hypothetical protein